MPHAPSITKSINHYLTEVSLLQNTHALPYKYVPMKTRTYSFFTNTYLHLTRTYVLQVAYPAVQISLGIKLNKSKGTPVPTRLPPRLLNQCLRDVFTYLLCKTPKVVVIESTHFVDMCSWEVLVNFGSVKSLAMFVITMEPLQDLELAKIKLAPDTLRGNTQLDNCI